MKGPSSLPVLGRDSRAGALRSTDLIGRSLPTLLLGFALGCLATYWYTGGSCTGGSATAEAGPGAGLLQKSPRAALGEGEGRPLPRGEAAGVPDCVTPAFPVEGPNSDWYSLKWVPPLAECRVAGLPIERLEPEYNYRRGFALGFTEDVEDKTHLVPFLRAAHDPSLGTRQRRVLLDLGGRTFDSSVLWFLRWYPLEFTEVHVFEVEEFIFQIPPHSTDEDPDLLASMNSSSNVAGAGSLLVPNRVLDRVHLHVKRVSERDGDGRVNIVRFIKEELKLTASDTVIVKMDIDYGEWSVLPEWERDEELPRIVDELFVEIHYSHPSMHRFGWSVGQPRDEANLVLQRLRDRGYYVHSWP